ncbi:MAG: hypothetical protein HKN68_16915 [Saprospiraceae bacterium]|nr:hypothetical protein [Saprospiraceae bacterium]
MKAALICFLFSISLTASAQNSPSFSTEAIGNWEGTGTLFNFQASFKMQWNQVLNDKFMKLVFENRFTDPSGIERIMSAHGYYDMENLKGQWFDSRGMILPLKLELEGKKMTVYWGDENTERGKTEYSIIEGNQIIVKDYVYRKDAYQTFGEAQYERLKE